MKTGQQREQLAHFAVILHEDDANSAFSAALRTELAAEIQAISNDKLLSVNVDIPHAVTTVLGVVPVLEALMPELPENMALPANTPARLRSQAYYLGYTHAEYVTLRSRERSNEVNLADLHSAALDKKRLLLSDCEALERRGLLPENFLGNSHSGNYSNTAVALLSLVHVLRTHWKSIAGKTAIQESEIEETDTLARQLLDGIAQREQRTDKIRAKADERTLAFTLLSNTYNQVRRAITWLRWNEGDVNELVPSLYARAGGTRKKKNHLPNRTISRKNKSRKRPCRLPLRAPKNVRVNRTAPSKNSVSP